MALVSCNACDRRHERPINSKCIYLKAAISKCAELGVSRDDYRLHLPDIMEPVTGGAGTPKYTHAAFPLLAEDVLALLQDNAECKRQLAETKHQLDTIITRLDNLSLNNVQGVSGAAGGVMGDPGQWPASTLIGTGLVGQVPVTTTSITTGITSVSSMYTAPVTSTFSSAWSPGVAGQNTLVRPPPPPGYSGSLWLPPPGLTGAPSASTTSIGAPLPGQQAWMSHLQSSITNRNWSTLLASSTAGIAPTAGPPLQSQSAPFGGTAVPTGHYAWSPPQPPTTSTPTPAGQPVLLTDPLGGPPVNVMIDATGIKSASKKRKCVVFDIEPHLYVDNIKTATIEDIISAEMSMLESMLSLGIPVTHFAKHIRFLSDKVRIYSSASLVKYDQAVREKAEVMGPMSFVYGDHEYVHMFLGMDSLKPKGKSSKEPSQTTSVKTGRNLRPRGICWRFNETRGCKKETCQWKHECRECGGEHSVVECKSKK